MRRLNINNLVAFTAPQLHAVLTAGFFIDYAQRTLVEGFTLEKSFRAILAATSQSNLARHTNVVHVYSNDDCSALRVFQYVFIHPKFRPWGQRLPPSCSICKSPRSWSLRSSKNETVVFKCKKKNCKGFCQFVRPDGYEMGKANVNGGHWMHKSYAV